MFKSVKNLNFILNEKLSHWDKNQIAKFTPNELVGKAVLMAQGNDYDKFLRLKKVVDRAIHISDIKTGKEMGVKVESIEERKHTNIYKNRPFAAGEKREKKAEHKGLQT